MMHKIEREKNYQVIQESGKGFVYNDFSPTGTQGEWNILHRASCRSLEQSNLNVDKYFFNSLSEAETWLNEHRDEDWRKCRTCLVS